MRGGAVLGLVIAMTISVAVVAPSRALAAGSADLDLSMIALDPALTSMITQTGAGYAYAYRIAVANAGPDTATNIVATLTFPAGASFTGSLPLGACTAGGGIVSCAFGSFAPLGGAAKVVLVTAPTTPGPAIASATVSASESDPNPSNDSATLSLTILPAHDLDITKSASPSPVGPGGAITYTITLHNAGPNDATNAGFVDTIPFTTTFSSIKSATTPVCGTAGTGPNDYGCGWALLPSGATRTATLVVIAPPFATTVHNSVRDFFNAPLELDPNPSNDVMTLDTDVVIGGPTPTPGPLPTPAPSGVDLRVTKTASTDYLTPPAVGGRVFYQIGVDAIGKSSSGFTITDTIPSGVTVTFFPSPLCSYAPPVLTCASSGLGVSFTIDGVFTHGGTITNTVSVTGLDADPDLSNNTASTTLVVPPSVDLALTNSGPGVALAGQTMTYTVGVTNKGPDASAGGGIKDTLPAGAVFVSASSGCVGGVTIVCAFGPLAVGSSTSFSIVAKAPPQGPAIDVATVGGNDPDPDPTNDTASVTTTITPLSDVSVTATASAVSVAPGGSLTYTVVATNGGPSDDPIVGMDDTLSGFVISSLSCVGASISVIDTATGHALCRWDAVAAGQTRTMTLTGTVAATATSAITDSVLVGGLNIDPDTSNNTASVSVAVINTAVSSAPETVTPKDTTTGTSPVSVTFAAVGTAGVTTLTTSASGPLPPSGFGFDGVYYDLSTTAAFTAPITICIAFSGATPAPRLWHFEAGAWVDVTTSVSATQVCGHVSSLSPFAVLRAPSAALLDELRSAVSRLPKGLATSLGAKIRAAQGATAPSACGPLNAFLDEVRAQRGKGLTDLEADSLSLIAMQARRQLCP